MRENPRRAVNCSDCGKGVGTTAGIGQGGLRCATCGRFAKPCPTFCVKHEIDWGNVTGYGHCPGCRQEERVEAMEMERMARRADPDMHPTVDAPRR